PGKPAAPAAHPAPPGPRRLLLPLRLRGRAGGGGGRPRRQRRPARGVGAGQLVGDRLRDVPAAGEVHGQATPPQQGPPLAGPMFCAVSCSDSVVGSPYISTTWKPFDWA